MWTRFRRWPAVTCVAFMAAWALATWTAQPDSPGITEANFRRVHVGMSYE